MGCMCVYVYVCVYVCVCVHRYQMSEIEVVEYMGPYYVFLSPFCRGPPFRSRLRAGTGSAIPFSDLRFRKLLMLRVKKTLLFKNLLFLGGQSADRFVFYRE
jgi:hypothetical protein